MLLYCTAVAAAVEEDATGDGGASDEFVVCSLLHILSHSLAISR